MIKNKLWDMDKAELIEEIYDLNLQNNTEKVCVDRAFKFGIETTIKELIEMKLLKL